MPHKDLAARRAYYRAWKAANRGRYKEQTRLYDQVKHANERAAVYGAPGTITTEDVVAVLAHGRCHYCGAPEGVPPFGLTLDHVIPLSAGGPNRRENLVASCHSCNASKWRGDAPGKWARDHDRCRTCGTTDRSHAGRGRCSACYQLEFPSPADLRRIAESQARGNPGRKLGVA